MSVTGLFATISEPKGDDYRRSKMPDTGPSSPLILAASVAKRSKAPVCGTGDHGFESRRSPQSVVPRLHAPVAQWIEHWASDPGVAGSTPARRAISRHQIRPPVLESRYLNLESASYNVLYDSPQPSVSFWLTTAMVHPIVSEPFATTWPSGMWCLDSGLPAVTISASLICPF